MLLLLFLPIGLVDLVYNKVAKLKSTITMLNATVKFLVAEVESLRPKIAKVPK